MIVWSIGVASASGGTPTCVATLTGTDPFTGITPTNATSYDVSSDTTCTNMPSGADRVSLLIPYDGGVFVQSIIGSELSTGQTGATTPMNTCTTGGSELPENFRYTVTTTNGINTGSTPTGTTYSCSPGVSTGYARMWWYSTPLSGTITPPNGDTSPTYSTGDQIFYWTASSFASQWSSTGVVTQGETFGSWPDCTLAGVYGANTATGQAFGYSLHTFAFYLEGKAPEIDIFPEDSSNAPLNPNYSSGFAPTDYVASSTPSGTRATGAPTYLTSGNMLYYFTNNQQSAYSVGTTDPPANYRQDVQVDYSTASTGTIPTTLETWCYSPSTGWVNWGDLLSISLAPGAHLPGSGTPPTSPQCTYSSIAQPCDGSGGGTGSFAACVAADAIGLSPASWVPGLINMGGCAVQALFVPSSSKVTALANSFGLTSNTPTPGADSASQWLGSVGYMLNVGPSAGAEAIQTCISAGCSAPAITTGISVTAGTHTYSVDAPSALTAVATSDGSWSTILVDILAAFILVAFFIEIARLLRKTTGSTE